MMQQTLFSGQWGRGVVAADESVVAADESLTVLSFGGGQDSTAILYKLVYDEDFRARYAPGRLVVVMSDTGDEHPKTYAHIEETKAFCAKHGIEFHFLTSDLGYHSDAWRNLRHQYNRNKSVGSKVYMKTCTTNLKISPIYKWLAEWVANEYGFEFKEKRSLVEFAKAYGKIRVLLGIAKREEGRVSPNYSLDDYRRFTKIRKARAIARKRCKELGIRAKFRGKAPDLQKWFVEAIEKVYPLIDLGMDRQACQDYIRLAGHTVPPPSNCMLCPFMSEIELLWLQRNHPEDYEDWVRIERAKIEEHARRGTPPEKNFGVWSTKLLPEKLMEAEAKHGHMTNADLDEYKMSHGHCVGSVY